MSTETEVQPAPQPVMASRDREETEIVETVELEQPPVVEKDYEDIIADSDDPRGAIYARSNEKRSDEIKQSLIDHPGENLEIPIENEQAPDILEATPETATPRDAVEMVEVKVLGDVRSVPKKQVDAQGGVENFQIRAAAKEQMERNANERSALAARQQAQDERERQWEARQAVLPAMDTRKSQTPDGLTPPDSQNLEEMARQYQEAVYDDAQEAPNLLATMVRTAAAAGNTFDQDAFRKQVRVDVLKDQRQAKIVTAGAAIIGKHPELQSRSDQFDQRMYDNINNETMVVEREYPNWEPVDVIAEAYKRIQKWKGGVSPQSETMSEKQAQKQAMARPRTGTQRFTPPPPPPRATNADYVASERKRRGLE